MTRTIFTSLAIAALLCGATPKPVSADGKEARKDITVEVFDQSHNPLSNQESETAQPGASATPGNATAASGGSASNRSYEPLPFIKRIDKLQP